MGQESSTIADYSNRNLKDIPDDGFNGLVLEDLTLSHNSLESIPNSIQLLSTLRTLDLSSNLLKQLPSTLPSVVSLTSLKVSRNVLTALPPNIGELVNLFELHVDHNQLRELPASIGDLNSLEVLVVSRNSLTLLPPTLGKLPRLQVFRAAKNRLQEVPTMLTFMPLLQVLAVDDNMLTELPSSLGKLRALRELTLSGNQLTSFSPAAIAKLENLQVLDISNNPGATRLPAEFIDSHIATIVYGCGAERASKTSTGSQIKNAKLARKHKKKKEKKEKKAKKKGSATDAVIDGQRGSRIEDSNSNSQGSSRQGSQIDGKGDRKSSTKDEPSPRQRKSGSAIESPKEVPPKEVPPKEARAEKTLSRLSGFFGMSKMHLTDKEKAKDADKAKAQAAEPQRRLSRHVQIADPPPSGRSKDKDAASPRHKEASDTQDGSPQQHNESPARLPPEGKNPRSPFANMTKEEIEEFKRQATLKYEQQKARNDVLRSVTVNIAESATERVKAQPLERKNRARSRHNLVLASIDEWLIEGAKETESEKAARIATGASSADDLFGDLDEFLSGDGSTPLGQAISAPPTLEKPTDSTPTAPPPPLAPSIAAPVDLVVPSSTPHQPPSLLDALDELNDVLDVPLTPRVFPEPTVQLVWEEQSLIAAGGAAETDPRGVPYEKGKVLKQFDSTQIQKMEESVRGPARSQSGDGGARGADGKRPTREVRTTAVSVEKGNARRPPLPPSGGLATTTTTTTTASSSDLSSSSASSSSSALSSSSTVPLDRPAPTPTVRGSGAPPVPPVPTSSVASPRPPSIASPRKDSNSPSVDLTVPLAPYASAPAALRRAPAPAPAADRNALINQSDKKGWTALTYSVFSGKPDTVRALLKTGAKVNQQFENGRTCLHIAALEGHADVVTVLLENGAAVQAEDNDGITALAAAASRGHAATVDALLQFNADPNQVDAEGMTPLMYASKKGSADAVRALTKAGAMVNQSVTGGITALMIAAMEGHTDAVLALVEAGAT